MNDIIEAAEKLTTSHLDELIQQLAAMRARHEPPVQLETPIGATIAPVVDPKYWTQHEPLREDTVLGIRHPGFGWIWFAFPPHERQRLLGYLQNQSRASIPPPPERMN